MDSSPSTLECTSASECHGIPTCASCCCLLTATRSSPVSRSGEDAPAIFGDAAGECARLAGAMKAVEGSGSAEASIMSQQARIAPGGAFPVLHALRESLTNFVLGLRSELRKGDHRLVLTSYTDLRVCRLPANESAGTPRFDRDGPSGKTGGPEKRVDPSDGCSYTQ